MAVAIARLFHQPEDLGEEAFRGSCIEAVEPDGETRRYEKRPPPRRRMGTDRRVADFRDAVRLALVLRPGLRALLQWRTAKRPSTAAFVPIGNASYTIDMLQNSVSPPRLGLRSA